MQHTREPQTAAITIDGTTYRVPLGDINGQELRELVEPAATDLWMDVPNAQDVPVGPEAIITVSDDMAFFTGKQITIYVDKRPYQVAAGVISEPQLRALPTPAIPDDHLLYKDVDDDLDDPILVGEIATIVDGTRFFTKETASREIKIVVNGTRTTFAGRRISFEDVVAIAFPNPPVGSQLIFTVSFDRAAGARPTGTLRAGQSVKIKDGTLFNVTATDKS